uniref:Interferon regulatory factor 1-like n=1 Tax=Haplochromis burtoni TaxID=8153 RepID=A0A3Q2X294_HAPBU
MKIRELNCLVMDSNRQVCNWISYTVLLFGYMTAAVLPGKNPTIGFSLECTYDFDQVMQCELELQNCTEYSMTLQDEYAREENCAVQQCGIGKCCCSFKRMRVLGQVLKAKVWKDGNIMESKAISVTESIKPRTPTIKSVNELEGNFEVKWTSNMEGILNNEMTAVVTYYKKGETEKTSGPFKPATVDGLNYYAIKGQDLDPSSAYVVSVKSFLSLSGKFSDSSEEWEFQTARSPHYLPVVIIICLSITAVILSAVMCRCYVKFKKNWWDVVTKPPNPSFLNIYPSKEQVLKPEPSITSTICIEPLIPDDSKLGSKMSLTDTSSGSLQQTSGISTGSSDLSYANAEPPETMNEEPPITKAVHDVLSKLFLNISPISPVATNPLTQLMNMQKSDLCSAPYSPCSVQANDTSSGSSVFENKTYSLLIPVSEHQAMTGDLEAQEKAEMLCLPDYHPSKSDMEICPHQLLPSCQVPAQQDSGSFLRQPNMPYQSYKADSGTFSYEEDTSLSSVSSGTNASDSCEFSSRAEAEFESSDEVMSGKPKLGEEVTICDENPCYGCVPKGSNSFLAMDDDYQALPSLEKQPDILLLEQGNGRACVVDYWRRSRIVLTVSLLIGRTSQTGACNNKAGSG